MQQLAAMFLTSDKPHYPFELPKGWVWCKLEDIAYDLMYGTSEKSSRLGKIPVLRMGNINREGGLDWKDLVYSNNEEDIEKFNLLHNDLLFNRTNSSEWVGKTAIYKGERPAIYAGYIIRLRTIFVNADYINFVMNSQYHRNWCNDVKTDAVNQSNINAQKLSVFRVPLPPIEEQKRIVKEIKRWLSLIKVIKSGKENLQESIKQTKSKVLDLAIHGKLVPQDPNEEPAIELLKRINPKAEIITDNGHYQKLPEGWCLTKGKYIFNQMKSSKPTGEVFRYIDIDAIDNKQQIIRNIKILKVANAPSRASRFTQKGDVVFSLVRPYLRNIAMVMEDDCIASTGFYVCHPTKVLLSKYCFYLMNSGYVVDGLNNFMKGDNSPSINKADIDNWVYPLPPLTEQKLIVAKIEELFTQLDTIEASL